MTFTHFNIQAADGEYGYFIQKQTPPGDKQIHVIWFLNKEYFHLQLKYV